MSMVINLVEDHNIYLCEGGPVYNGGVQPTPITYLTQWKIVGNSEVHNLPYADIPLGYTKCKYLIFNNGQYFDSGILTSNDIGIRIKFATSTQRNTMIGARKSNSSSAYLFGYFDSGGTAVYVGYGGSSKSVSLAKSYTDGNTHTLILDSTQAKIDNEDISFTRGTGTEFFNILIGTWNNNGAVDSVNAKYTGKIEEVKIYNSNQTLGNFIPCLDDNNVPCLYDTVSQTTLYNQGIGTCDYEIEPQPTEIWSCGEYSAVDGKYHILVKPQGGSIVDIALTEPLRKVEKIADTIEFPSDTKALVTRNIGYYKITSNSSIGRDTRGDGDYRWGLYDLRNMMKTGNTNILCSHYPSVNTGGTYNASYSCIAASTSGAIIYDTNYSKFASTNAFMNYAINAGVEMIYVLATPTTELVDAPQIAEAESYTCEISQGGKAVSWSSFETNSE